MKFASKFCLAKTKLTTSAVTFIYGQGRYLINKSMINKKSLWVYDFKSVNEIELSPCPGESLEDSGKNSSLGGKFAGAGLFGEGGEVGLAGWPCLDIVWRLACSLLYPGWKGLSRLVGLSIILLVIRSLEVHIAISGALEFLVELSAVQLILALSHSTV